MKDKVTLADIAAKIGVSVQTVSLALRGAPRISEAMRARIQKAARRMGYCPDPLLQALHSYRRRVRSPRYQATLGYVTGGATADSHLKHRFERWIFEGAQARAKEMGYLLEPLWFGEKGMTEERFGRVILARGILGVLVAPLPHIATRLRLPWEDLAIVGFGITASVEGMHRILADYSEVTEMGWRKCLEYGCRRPALCLTQAINDRTNRMYAAAFRELQSDLPEANRIAPHVMARWDAVECVQWARKARADAVLFQIAQPLATAAAAFRAAGVRVPGDVALINLNLAMGGPEEAGIFVSPHHIGAAGTDILAGKIQRGERGFVQPIQRTLIEGEWRDGQTAAPKFNDKPKRR